MAKLWTASEIQFLQNNLHLTDKECGVRLNRTENSVNQKRFKLRLLKPIIDLTGQKFGCLIVLSRIQTKGPAYYKCICDCGKIKNIRGANLKFGSSTSCGCRKVHRKLPGEYAFNQLWSQLKGVSKISTYKPIDISFEQFKKIIQLPCFYCGHPPTPFNPYKNRKFIHQATFQQAWINVNGIDRRDNNKGYTQENCVPCCEQCNRAKLDYTEAEFLNHITRIYEFQKNK